MEFNLNPFFKGTKDFFQNSSDIMLAIEELNNLFLKETYKGNKVAYYYENINNKNVISYNSDICFYAASSIKILVCLMLFQKAGNNEIDLNQKLLVTMEDLKQDTGVIKFQKQNTEYSILELIKLTIIESDNTAYLKLVNLIGKEKIKEYGLSLGAKHTMESKPTDSFGIVNCRDMIIYWKEVKRFIDTNPKYGPIFKNYLSHPTVKLVKDEVLKNYNYIRKYGSWDIAYNEAGYIDGECYIIILTQLNKCPYKEDFINKAATSLLEINKKFFPN